MPTKKQIDAILPFLQRFTDDGFTVGAWHSPPGQFPWFELSEPVSEFQQSLYDNGWVKPSFDWGKWQEAAQEYVEQPQKIDTANITVIQKLLTTHVRKERFAKGIWPRCLRTGMWWDCCERLKTIRKNSKSA